MSLRERRDGRRTGATRARKGPWGKNLLGQAYRRDAEVLAHALGRQITSVRYEWEAGRNGHVSRLVYWRSQRTSLFLRRSGPLLKGNEQDRYRPRDLPHILVVVALSKRRSPLTTDFPRRRR
jgi:hypothetical protein